MRTLVLSLFFAVVALLGAANSGLAATPEPTTELETLALPSESALITLVDTDQVAQPDAVVVQLNFSKSQDGSWIGTGSLQNLRDSPMDVEIGAIGYGAGDNKPVIDAPTLFIPDVAPGATRQLSIKVPSGAQPVNWSWKVQTTSVSSPQLLEVELGTTKKLTIDPYLAGTVDALRSVDGGDWLLRVAAENGAVIRRGPTGPDVLGSFEPLRNRVTISNSLDRSSSWVRATVLSHELQHVADLAAGASPSNPVQCYGVESAAFQRQARTWMALWRGNLPPNLDPVHTEMNAVTTKVTQDPAEFTSQLVTLYRSECGPLP